MGLPRTYRDLQRSADADLKRLRSEYDADKGGYNITTGSGNTKHTQFIKSDFTPEQGGYYADKSILHDPTKPYKANTYHRSGNTYLYYDPNRAAYITGNTKGTKFNETQVGTGGAVGRDKIKRDAEGYRLFPKRGVNPTVTADRKTRRRRRALQAGRSGTILTGTLGKSDEKERNYRKTLLG